MCKTIIAVLPLLISSWGLAQNAPAPAQPSLAAQARSTSAAPVTEPYPEKKDKDKDAEKAQPAPKAGDWTLPAAQGDRTADPILNSVSSTGLNATVGAPAKPIKDALADAKTLFVVSHSFFVKKEQIEMGLLSNDWFEKLGLQITQNEKAADLILSVKRAPFQNNFPFTLTDRQSGLVVMGGQVNSLFGTVPGKIAGRITDKVRELRKAREQNPPEKGPAEKNANASSTPSWMLP